MTLMPTSKRSEADLEPGTEVPEFASREEAAQWFDTHDTSELWDDPVQPEPTRNPMVSHSIRFDRPTIDRIRAVADARGVGVTSLMRQWVIEKLEENTAQSQGVEAEIITEIRRLASLADRLQHKAS
jgi:hypothetical protein